MTGLVALRAITPCHVAGQRFGIESDAWSFCNLFTIAQDNNLFADIPALRQFVTDKDNGNTRLLKAANDAPIRALTSFSVRRGCWLNSY